MDDNDTVRDQDEFEDEDSEAELLRDRFRISAIAIAEAEEQLAKDLELFAHHAGRKTVNMEDVINSLWNDHLSAILRSARNEMKANERHSERKSKKPKRKEDIATTSGYHADSKQTHAATDALPYE